jgi:hypothetical protein
MTNANRATNPNGEGAVETDVLAQKTAIADRQPDRQSQIRFRRK